MQLLECSFRQSTIAFLKGGQGPAVLLCLHGFGEHSASFSFLEEELGRLFTIYAPDFPWHGTTQWKEGLVFTPDMLVELLQQMIPDFEQKSVTILGYSMGGRVGLHLLQLLPAQIRKMVLLAPDGLTLNPWYYLATQTQPGNRLFHYTMNHPRWFQQLVVLLNRSRLINRSIAKFVLHSIDRTEVRTHLFRVWTTMRAFRPHLKKLQAAIINQRIPVVLVFGRYDRVIASKHGRVFQKGVKPFVTVHELEEGHQLLRPKHRSFIISLLRHE